MPVVTKMNSVNRLRMAMRKLRAKYVAQGAPDVKELAKFDATLRRLDDKQNLHPIK
jgi:hypothetical protein